MIRTHRLHTKFHIKTYIPAGPTLWSLYVALHYYELLYYDNEMWRNHFYAFRYSTNRTSFLSSVRCISLDLFPFKIFHCGTNNCSPGRVQEKNGVDVSGGWVRFRTFGGKLGGSRERGLAKRTTECYDTDGDGKYVGTVAACCC